MADPNLSVNNDEEVPAAAPAIMTASGEGAGAGKTGEILAKIEQVFKALITDDGRAVDYKKLADSGGGRELSDMAASFADLDPGTVTENDGKLEFWINIHNMLVIKGIGEHSINGSVMEVRDFFKRVACNVGGCDYSLDDIEYGILRENRRLRLRPWRQFRPWDERRRLVVDSADERLCFALSRGFKGGPPVRFYRAEKIEAQLTEAATSFINSGGVLLDRESKTLVLSRMFQWHAADFGGAQGVMKFIINHLGSVEDAAFLRTHIPSLRVSYQLFDRGLNSPS